MSVYLIDFENVQDAGLSGLLNLSSKDSVYVFYSEFGKKLSFDLHQQILRSSAAFYYHKVAVGGKNALDQQLSSFLGYLIGSSTTQKYYIVSKDQGYRYAINFWTNQKEIPAEVELIDSIKFSRQGNGNTGQSQTESQPVSSAEVHMVTAGETEVVMAADATSRPKRSRGRRKKPIVKVTSPDNTIVSEVVPEAIQELTHDTVEEKSKQPDSLDMVTTTVVELPKVNQAPLKVSDRKVIKHPDSAESAKTTELSSSVREKIITEDDVIAVVAEAGGKEWLKDVVRYMNTAKSKSELYNSIRKRLGQDTGRRVYNLLKKM